MASNCLRFPIGSSHETAVAKAAEEPEVQEEQEEDKDASEYELEDDATLPDFRPLPGLLVFPNLPVS